MFFFRFEVDAFLSAVNLAAKKTRLFDPWREKARCHDGEGMPILEATKSLSGRSSITSGVKDQPKRLNYPKCSSQTTHKNPKVKNKKGNP